MRLADANLLKRALVSTDEPREEVLKRGRMSVNTNLKLSAAEAGREYIIRDVVTQDDELNGFLFSLGCYSGEPITVVRRLKGGMVVSIKDGRYNIDNELAAAILV